MGVAYKWQNQNKHENALILAGDKAGYKGFIYDSPTLMETKTLIWTQPRPTSKLLCFCRQWWAPTASFTTLPTEA